MKKKSIENVQLTGKRVFMRADFNVPVKDGVIGDDTRIQATIPTIKHILDQKPKRLVISSHLGRPGGSVVPEMSLAPVAKRLAEILGTDVAMMPDCVGDEVKAKVDALPDGGIALLENVRFHAEETSKVEAEVDSLAKQFGEFADVFIGDAFGSAHRAHASVCNVAKFVDESAAGFLLKKEIDYLIGAIEAPERPFVAILGGAKISGKIDVISNLLGKVDSILIGGAMAYTFLKAMGIEVGKSLVEEDRIELAKETLEKAKSAGKELILPTDHLVVAAACEEGQATQATEGQAIPADMVAVDYRPEDG